jgi:hypothetical protein
MKRQKVTAKFPTDIARVALAVRKLIAASSGARGVDCYSYVTYGQHLLHRLGIPAEIAVGYAAWRVGDGDADVVGHHPSMSGNLIAVRRGRDAAIYHAWLEVAGRIIDFSTCDLPRKAALNDAADGMRTTISWSPDYLLAEKHEVVSFLRVRQEHAGLFYYERVPSLEAKARADALPPDETTLGILWMIYQNPDMNVIGPADAQ